MSEGEEGANKYKEGRRKGEDKYRKEETKRGDEELLKEGDGLECSYLLKHLSLFCRTTSGSSMGRKVISASKRLVNGEREEGERRERGGREEGVRRKGQEIEL